MKRLLATLLAAGMVLSLAACGKEPEQQHTEKAGEESLPTQEVSASVSYGPEGEYKSNDTEEHFKIYNLTDTGFMVEFYHFEEGLLEKFDYEMEFDNAEKTVASEKGSVDDNGGWEYTFYLGGDTFFFNDTATTEIYTRVIM